MHCFYLLCEAMCVLFHLLLVIFGINGARILGYIPTPCYSHQIVFQPLWRELSLRGHQVTTITSHPINDPSLTNLTEINVSDSLQTDSTLNIVDLVTETSERSVLSGFRLFFEQMIGVIDAELNHHAVKDLINRGDVRFDLVIGEYFFASPFAFAKRFNCPSIGVLPVDGWNGLYRMVGSPSHPTLYPDYVTSPSDQLSLLDRVETLINSVLAHYYLVDYPQRKEEEVIEKHFGKRYPSPQELLKNISLFFVNSDPIFHPIRPLVPTVIQIGLGFHLTSSKPLLAQELQKSLDNASNGFIYFSLGSTVKSEILSPKILEIFLSVFAELPYQVYWKYERDTLPNKTDNVIISKWFPQREILKHPNIKLFITQGGLQSLEEAIYAHVPIVGIPIFTDQRYNIGRMVRRGCGLILDHKDLEEKQFKDAIVEVISNPKYRNTMKRLANLAQDQPMTGLEKAVWWSEYVIRHKGAKHLRSPLLSIPWHQFLLLDVIGVLGLSVCGIVCLIYYPVKVIRRIINNKCHSTLDSKEKKN
ncbi:hypothetical protein RI129_012494 [Pyrocoelia pectoralis]|uniref:UDP-glucuronosyltransferase n=1 Tax=Pyrocoelia pectoralis TaxID=417401 RepID=A0AAN7V0H5_9COLE